MKVTLYAVALVLFVIVVCDGDWPNTKVRSRGEIWPKPQNIVVIAEKVWAIEPNKFQFSLKSSSCIILNSAIKRYRKRLFGKLKRMNTTSSDNQEYLNKLTITVHKCKDNDYPQLGMDESYDLHTNTNDATLMADEVWGALRGLESFAQLFFINENGEINIRAVTIKDFPRFAHRGVLLDTSRHYLSVNLLKANLELMAQNKFNTFHWHIVDIQSFPYKSKIYPELIKGAYTPNHIYTIEQIQSIVEYARLRGIRVLAEFDTPGHMNSWGVGLPQLVSRCFDSSGQEIMDDRGVFDMTNGNNWDILLALFKEIYGLFPDNYIHLGGDEVEFWTKTCWINNQNVTAFMKQYGLNDTVQLEKWYFKKLINMLNGKSMGKKRKNFLVWEEVLQTGIKDDRMIVHVWQGYDLMAQATRKGYYAILSSCWYLNYINRDVDWTTYYTCDPQDFNGTRKQMKLVLGGEAALWGEWVNDSNAISRLWPRASAVGERLWSSKETTDQKDAWLRLYEMQCRMAAQGYPVQPAWGPGYCEYEYQSNLPTH